MPINIYTMTEWPFCGICGFFYCFIISKEVQTIDTGGNTTCCQLTAYSGSQIIVFNRKKESSNLSYCSRLLILFLGTLLLIP